MEESVHTPVVSVIMPVYNTERYVDMAIESVVNQSFTDWELILVDDCSSDGSADICRKWEKADRRIKLVSLPKNSGPARARNIGMDNARGKYLAFIDSDDTYEPEFLKIMADVITTQDSDVVMCNYTEVLSGTETRREHGIMSNIPIASRELMYLVFKGTCGMGPLWNKMYRRDTIERIELRINEDRVRAEDWEFNLFLFPKIDSLVAIDDALYNYQRNSDSVMATYRRKDFELMCRSQELLLDVANRYFIAIDDSFWSGYLYNVISHIVVMYKNEGENKGLRLREIIGNPTFKYAMENGNSSQLTPYQTAIYYSIKSGMTLITQLLLKF